MSYLHALTVISFHEMNPDWQIIVYVTRQEHKASDGSRQNPVYKPYVGQDHFFLIEELPYVEIREIDFDRPGIHSILISDIWRREILFDNGGVYSDFDCLWVRPMSDLLNVACLGDPSNFECTVSFFGLTKGFHNVSNIIAEKGSPFLRSLILRSSGIHPPYGDQSFGTDMLNNLYPTLDTITSTFPRVLALEYETFYPYYTGNLGQLYKEVDLVPMLNPNVLCVHWFNGNDLSKEYINEGGYDRECSMTSILRKEGYL